jgi:hypothetical protein
MWPLNSPDKKEGIDYKSHSSAVRINAVMPSLWFSWKCPQMFRIGGLCIGASKDRLSYQDRIQQTER